MNIKPNERKKPMTEEYKDGSALIASAVIRNGERMCQTWAEITGEVYVPLLLLARIDNNSGQFGSLAVQTTAGIPLSAVAETLDKALAAIREQMDKEKTEPDAADEEHDEKIGENRAAARKAMEKALKPNGPATETATK